MSVILPADISVLDKIIGKILAPKPVAGAVQIKRPK
jgi:hypothetical protein